MASSRGSIRESETIVTAYPILVVEDEFLIALDIVAALERLKSRYKLVILSNGDRDMLKAAGPHIGFPFDLVISVQEAGYFKPHWKTYAKAEELIGHHRSNCLFVANHAFDCIGAKSYGMRTAFIDRRKRPFGETPHRPDLIVANFAELAAELC